MRKAEIARELYRWLWESLKRRIPPNDGGLSDKLEAYLRRELKSSACDESDFEGYLAELATHADLRQVVGMMTERDRRSFVNRRQVQELEQRGMDDADLDLYLRRLFRADRLPGLLSGLRRAQRHLNRAMTMAHFLSGSTYLPHRHDAANFCTSALRYWASEYEDFLDLLASFCLCLRWRRAGRHPSENRTLAAMLDREDKRYCSLIAEMSRELVRYFDDARCKSFFEVLEALNSKAPMPDDISVLSSCDVGYLAGVLNHARECRNKLVGHPGAPRETGVLCAYDGLMHELTRLSAAMEYLVKLFSASTRSTAVPAVVRFHRSGCDAWGMCEVEFFEEGDEASTILARFFDDPWACAVEAGRAERDLDLFLFPRPIWPTREVVDPDVMPLQRLDQLAGRLKEWVSTEAG